jgi:hypothetical protein
MNVSAPSRQQLEWFKIIAITSGVRIAESVVESFGGLDALTVHEYATTGGITLELPSGVLVNAPFDDAFCAVSPLELVREAGLLFLRLPDAEIAVTSVVPLPGYLSASDSQGRLASDVVMSHADRIRLSPIIGCAYDCKFCDLAAIRYERRPTEQLLVSRV